MRYEIGQQLWTIAFKLTFTDSGKPCHHIHSVQPVPGMYDIQSIRFHCLTITEHHRVPGEWDDKLQYDGFIAVDAKGNRWENQFPRASYGQTSDYADGDFQLAMADDWCRENVKSNVPFEALFDFIDAQELNIATYDLIRFMGSLDGGILNDDGTTEFSTRYPDIYPKLQAISERIQKEFREATGMILEPRVKTWQHPSGEKSAVKFREWHVVNPVPRVESEISLQAEANINYL